MFAVIYYSWLLFCYLLFLFCHLLLVSEKMFIGLFCISRCLRNFNTNFDNK